MLEYIHLGFASVFERNLIITVSEGRVLDRRVQENRPEIIS